MKQLSSKKMTVELASLQLGLSDIRRDVICKKENLTLKSETSEKELNKLHKKYFGRNVKKL